MSNLQTLLAAQIREFKSNKRLQYGSIAILLIALIDGGLRWSDRITQQAKDLQTLAGEIAALKQQAMNEGLLKEMLANSQTARETVETRLWVAPTDAIGQARLKDWLLDLTARTGISNPNLNLANPRPIEEKEDSAHLNSETKSGTSGLKRFRATLSFRFSPETLERSLMEIEGGAPFAKVDTLVVNKREMRAEIGLTMLIRIVPNKDGAPQW